QVAIRVSNDRINALSKKQQEKELEVQKLEAERRTIAANRAAQAASNEYAAFINASKADAKARIDSLVTNLFGLHNLYRSVADTAEKRNKATGSRHDDHFKLEAAFRAWVLTP